MGSPRFESIADYFSSIEPVKAHSLQAIVDYVIAQFPELAAKIAWSVPQIHRDGKYVLGLAAFKNHLTVAPWSPEVIADFKQRLDCYVVKKHCFQIPIDWKIEKKLLKDMVRARLVELDRHES